MSTNLPTEAAPLPPIYRHGNSELLPTLSQRKTAAATQPWTATRCHRQLRPLLTHLVALRREKAIAELKKKNDTTGHLQNTSKRRQSDNDLTTRKRIRYTYSLKGTGRRRHAQPGTADSALFQREDEFLRPERTKIVPLKHQSRHSFNPGEIIMATPVLSRARKYQHGPTLPSSPISHCTSIGTSTVKSTALLPTGGEVAREKPDMSFKYRGYYHGRPAAGSDNNIKTPVDKEWATLAKATPPEFRQLYESILRTVDALLRATTDSESSSGRPNSLLAMCLRKVPQYIAICEEAEREELEKTGAARSAFSDVSLDIYNDLEPLGGASTGWKHLRTVVREHGINILKEACAEGLLHEAFVRLLVRLCISSKAYEEAEGLMEALLNSHISSSQEGQCLFWEPDEAGSSLGELTGAMASIDLLIRYADETGRTSVALRQVTGLLNSGHLPTAWLSTQTFASLWHRVIRLLSSRGAAVCDESILLDFSTTAVTKLVTSGSTDNPLSSDPRMGNGEAPESDDSPGTTATSSSSFYTLTSILGSICAISILQREAAVDSSHTRHIHTPAVARRLSVIIHRSLSETGQIAGCRGQCETSGANFMLPRRYLLALALYLSDCDIDRGTDGSGEGGSWCYDTSISDELCSYPSLDTDELAKGQLYDATISFITSVAESCGRGSKSDIVGTPAARGYLINICWHASNKLSNLLNLDCNTDLFERLHTGSAYLLASRSNDLRDLAFAESLGKNSASANSRRSMRDSAAEKTPASAPYGMVTSPPLKMRPVPPTGLFEGYRWEEGISEWVISTPTSNSSSHKLRQGHESGVSVDVPPLEDKTPTPDAGSVQKPSVKQRRLLNPVPFSTPPPSSWDSSSLEDMSGSDENSNDAWLPLKLPSNRVRSSIARPERRRLRKTLSQRSPPSSDSDWEPEKPWRMRPKRSSLSCSDKLRTRQSLLSLVSDSDDDDDDAESVDTNESDETENSFCPRDNASQTARTPLFDLVGNARRSIGAGHIQQNHKPAGSASKRIIDDSSSDDELCL